MLRLAFAVFLFLTPQALAEEYLVGGYWAYIGAEDLTNSQGARLNHAEDILRQDRANVHRFGIRQAGDESDDWFFQPGARAAMAKMFRAGGGIDPEYQQIIRSGNVGVYVKIYAVDGTFTSLRINIPG